MSSDLRGGVKVREGGTQFALFSRHATKVELCSFDDAGRRETGRLALQQYDDHIWRGFLHGVGVGHKYGYRVHGPYDPQNGHWFNPAKLLVDPFACQLFGGVVNDPALFTYEQGDDHSLSGMDLTDSAAYVPKSVVTDGNIDATDLAQLRTPSSETTIYELHVAGFSRQHPDLPEGLRGTFEGLTSTPLLRHMSDLGITAVELLPVTPFNDEPHLWKQGLSNYWGYNPYNFFAPDPRFGNPQQFRAMVRRFHQAGIEVLLDVVFNHTGEGDAKGPTLSFRGIDNASYYRHLPHEPGTYVNDTGCGNTLDMDDPYVCEMVIASLRHWAGEMGVDGFRFDLAPVLGRSMHGFSADAPFFRQVREDPLLSSLKLIAEPWDIGPGGYQLGEFPLGWSEWNDKYRDTVRAFWRGDNSVIGELAERISGSKGLFASNGRRPQAGVNFIAAHDGFTLHDLVSYEHKRNDANGEQNRDGHSHNISRNYGAEGETTDSTINDLRARQKRNMLATMFLSQGIPLLQAGDEFGRTQQGNNNSYCQDNEISWLDWQNGDLELTQFVTRLIKLRRTFPQLGQHGFLSGQAGLKGQQNDVTWLSPEGAPMENSDWELPYARCFGFHLAGVESGDAQLPQPLLVLLNAHHESIDFKLPSINYGRSWRSLLATDEFGDEQKTLHADHSLALPGHSFLVLAGEVGVDAGLTGDDLYSLSDLCGLAGIEEAYSDLSGQTHYLQDEDKRHLARILRGDTSTPQAVDSLVRRQIGQHWQRLMEPVIVLRQSSQEKCRQWVAIHLSERQLAGDLAWSIQLEDRQTIRGILRTDDLRLQNSKRIDNELIHELLLDLPEQLPFGYHDLTIETDHQSATARLIIAPSHCYQPSWMDDNEHLWGIAHQLYSLGNYEAKAGDKGIGDFSDLADLAFAAGKNGADVLGVSPLHALFPQNPERASPYSPSSRLALNTLFLDVTKMDGFGECPDVERSFEQAGKKTTSLVDYVDVALTKAQAFEQLYQFFLANASAGSQRQFADFCVERGQNLRTFARFSALCEKFEGLGLDEWPTAYQNPDSRDVRAFAKAQDRRVYYHCWLQWQADKQLQAAAQTCKEQGMKVGLYGDLAVGVAGDGAERWANSSNFLHELSFGAPPDAFNSNGQNWCMPPFDPTRLTRAAYQPFIDMLRENMRYCGALRLDHVMWLQRMFVIPLGQSAAHGAYIRYPFDDLLGILALESTRQKCLVIGEDLGTVPLGFRERMARENILSYRLMRFETEHDGSYTAPNGYPYRALATPSSHDLPTLRGFLSGEDLELAKKLDTLTDKDELVAARKARDDEIQQLINALQGQELLAREDRGAISNTTMLDELSACVSLYLARSKAALVLLNLEDLAGSFEQVNVPGTVNEVPNWRHCLGFDPARLLEDEQLQALFDLMNSERKKI